MWGNQPGLSSVLDSDAHLWERKKFTVPFVTAKSDIDKDFGTQDYITDIGGVGVRAILMESDVKPEEKKAELDFFASVMKERSPFVGFVAGCYPEREKFAEAIQPIRVMAGFKGLRRVLDTDATPKGFFLKQQFVENLRWLGKQNIHFELCVRSTDLGDAAKLIQLCPETTFALSHCGNPQVTKPDISDWKRDIDAIGKLKNVHCKLSGMMWNMPKEEWEAYMFQRLVNHVMECFGIDRIIFGSDWPRCNLGCGNWSQFHVTMRECVAKRPTPGEQHRKVFYDNGAKFYKVT